jgi:hypothetical protein
MTSATAPERRYYQEYSEYAKNVRIWLVAYGVGGPALIVTQPSLYNAIWGSGHAHTIALAFLLGVAVQVLTALLYKAAAWNLHYTEELGRGKPSQWAKRVERWYWIDVIADVITLALFVYSTICIFRLLPSCLQVPAAA